jgi:hypothetical protein
VDAPIYSDTGSAAAVLIGSGAENAILVDSGSGVLIASGSGADVLIPPVSDLTPGHILTPPSRARALAPAMQRVWVLPARARTFSEDAA